MSDKPESEQPHDPAYLDQLREDLKHQLNTPDDIDWSYFMDTAWKAFDEAEATSRNMSDR